MFDINGKFFNTLVKIGDFLILSAVLFLCCLPVITIGPALTGAFYVALKEVKDEEGYVIKDFFKSFKLNLVQGIIINIIMAAIGAFLIMDVYWAYQSLAVTGSTVYQILLFIFLGVCLLYLAETIYVYATLAKFDNTIGATMRNALVMAVGHFPSTLMMCFPVVVFGYVAFAYNPAILIPGIPACLYMCAFVLSRIFTKIIRTNEEKEENAEEQAGAEEAEPSQETDEM